MSWELNRVRMHSVGPPDARYEDLVLDFSDTTVDTQPALISLINGGGKTVLLKLIFSVLRAGRRNVIGADSSPSTLAAYVLATDCSHVILELRRRGRQTSMLADEQELLICGKVSDWRDHVASSDLSRLRDQWYTFRPRPGALTLDTLPITDMRDGRSYRRYQRAYMDQLRAAYEQEPALRLVTPATQRDWREHLDTLGLDPELISLQARMNADEGEAAHQFNFATHLEFVQFLLNATEDDSRMTAFADDVEEHQQQLARRGEWQLEQTFAEGAVDRLRSLHGWYVEREQAQEEQAGTQRRALRLYEQLAAAAEHEQADAASHAAEAERLSGEASRLNTLSRELGAQLIFIERSIAEFDEQAAREKMAAAEEHAEEQQAEADAWGQTGQAARFNEQRAKLESLRALLDTHQQELAPLRERAQRAAGQLAFRLQSLAEEAEQAAATASAEADERRRDARELDERSRTQSATASDASARASDLQRRLQELDSTLARLISDGLMMRGQTPALALTQLQQRESELAGRVDGCHTTLAEHEQGVHTAEDARRGARDRVSELRVELAQLGELIQDLCRRRDELQGHPRLTRMLDADTVELWRDAGSLQERLQAAVTDHRRHQVDLEVDVSEDRRARQGITATQLLPAGRDLESVVQALCGQDIAAVTGWSYLKDSVAAGQHEQLLARNPALVDAVLVPEDQYADAQRAAQQFGEIKRSLLLVSIERFEAAGDAAEGELLAWPAAGLYDVHAAATMLPGIVQRMEQAAERRDELERAVQGDQELLTAILALLHDCPAGRLQEHEAARDILQTELAEAEAAAQAADTLIAEYRAGIRAQRDLLREVESERLTLAGRKPRLRDAADREQQRERWQTRQAAAESEAKAAFQAAEQLATLSDQSRQRESAEREAATGYRHTAQSHRAEKSMLAGYDADLPVGADVDIAQLRSSHQTLTAQLRERSSEKEINAQIRAAEESFGLTAAELDAQDAATVARAQQLLATSRGADTVSRSEATHQARQAATAAQRTASDLSAAHQSAMSELATARNAAERERSGRRPLERDPENREDGEQMRGEAERSREEVNVQQRAADTQATEAAAARDEAGGRGAVFASHAQRIADKISDLLPDARPDMTARFSQTPDVAREQCDSAVAALKSTASRLDEAKFGLVDDQRQLQQYAAEERFKELTVTSRLQNADVAATSGELADSFDVRARQAAAQIAELETHRRMLIERFSGMVTAALASLGQVRSASMMPAGLGDWSGHPFVKIDFERVESEDAFRDRLGAALEQAAQSSSRTGMSLLMAGVRSAVSAKGFKVSIMKPNQMLSRDRLDITMMKETFSGGQKLTSAIVLYCTIAAMRARARGRDRSDGAGLLILDNPLGTANAEHLMRVQVLVAQKLGAQLIYTSGLEDPTALSFFRRILRLRNDQSLRSAMLRISLDSSVTNPITGGRELSDPNGYLSASELSVAATEHASS